MKVALIDDSAMVRRSVGAALRKLGHEPVEVQPLSVFEVARALRQAGADLAIIDLMMPNCPGMSVVRFIREDPDLSELPILIVSANVDRSSAHILSQLGVQGVLNKPFPIQELQDCLDQGMAGKLWKPPDSEAIVAVVGQRHGLRPQIIRALEGRGFYLREVEADSTFGVLEALLEDPPNLILVGQNISGCHVASILRSIREDPTLGPIPLMLYGQNPVDAYTMMEAFRIRGFLDLSTHPSQRAERFSESITEILQGGESHGSGSGP